MYVTTTIVIINTLNCPHSAVRQFTTIGHRELLHVCGFVSGKRAQRRQTKLTADGNAGNPHVPLSTLAASAGFIARLCGAGSSSSSSLVAGRL